MSKLDNLADALYGTDEEIMNLNQTQALELAGWTEADLAAAKGRLRRLLQENVSSIDSSEHDS